MKLQLDADNDISLDKIYAETNPCVTAPVEETCDLLKKNGIITRHGCPITFQSEITKVIVGELTKELLKRPRVA